MRRSVPLRRSPFKARYRPRPGLRQARNFVRDRANGMCEARIPGVCELRGTDAHHAVKRSQGGSDDPGNLYWLCRACHTWAHANEIEARRRGLIRSREAKAS